MIRTHLIRRTRTVVLATATALALISPGAALPGQAMATAAPDITAMFVDGWYPSAYLPRRPLTITGPLDMHATANTVQLVGTSTSQFDAGFVDIVVGTGNSDPIALGDVGYAMIATASSACGSAYIGHATVLELERANDGTVTKFAASVWSHCPATNPPTTDVHAEVRYHSTIGFTAVDFSPMPAPWFGTPATSMDFGNVPVGTASSPKTEIITNTGTQSLSVSATAPANADFTIDTSACVDKTLAPGDACQITVVFAPQSTGDKTATLTLLTPGLDPTLDRTMRIGGTGTAAAQISLSALGSPPVDMSLDGVYWFSLDLAPSQAVGTFDLYATCQVSGNGVHAAIGQAPLPYLAWMNLPPGPCSASVQFQGSNGWQDSSAGPVSFTVPSFSGMYITSTTGSDWMPQSHSPAGVPVTITAHLTATNGATPSGGTVTIRDTDTDTVVGTGDLGADQTFSAVTDPLSAGTHHYKVEYSGDGMVVGITKATMLFVDGDAPVGQAAIDGGSPTTASPDVTLGLTATDASTSVTSVRISNTATVAGGLLADGTTSDAVASLPWTLPGSDGSKTVYVQWRDAVGNWSSPIGASVILDRTTPVIDSGPRVDLGAVGSGLSSSGAPGVISWAAHDAGSGLATYDVRVAVDGAAPLTVRSDLASSSLGVSLRPGHTYRFAVRARDKAGNVSAWADGSTVRVAAVQQSSPTVHWTGTWTTATGAAWWGGSAKSSTRYGSTATVTFTGREFAWVGLRAPSRGRAQVFVDNALAATVDLRSSSTQTMRLVWRRVWTSVGTHTVRIRILATAGRPRVDVDGFVILR